jgi:hypothetical protein
MFPSLPAGVRGRPPTRRRLGGQAPSHQGSEAPPSSRRGEVGQPPCQQSARSQPPCQPGPRNQPLSKARRIGQRNGPASDPACKLLLAILCRSWILHLVYLLILVRVYLSRANTGMLSLAPLKCAALGVCGPHSESHLLPPYTEPLSEHAQNGLVVATEVVGPVAPPPPSGADNSGGEQTTIVATAAQVAAEVLVEDTSGGGDAGATSIEQISPHHRRPGNMKSRRRDGGNSSAHNGACRWGRGSGIYG